MENEILEAEAEAVSKTETEAETEQTEVETLRKALEEKENALAALHEMQSKYAAAFDEFRREFPDVPISSLDEALWEQVKSGVPLAAAYALKMHREEKNETVQKGGWKSLDEGVSDQFYSPSEVRRMTQSEVRKNYARICESMKHW